MNNIIEININDYNEAILNFNHNKLSNELASYIYNQAMTMPFKQSFNLVITCNEKLSQKQKDNLVDMIRSNFGLEIKRITVITKYQNIRQLFVFIVGVILIALANLKYIKDLSIIHEIYMIAGWVAIWEVIYNILFEDIKKRFKLKKYKQLTQARIDFK